MSDTKFRPTERLSGRTELAEIRKEGRRQALPELALFFCQGKPGRKIAFAATRRVGNAPARHRHIRKLREFYRLNKELFAEGTHYLFVMRSAIENWAEFEERLNALLFRIRL